jgi:hypothetical protein
MLKKYLCRYILFLLLLIPIHCSDFNHFDEHHPEFALWTVGSGDINTRFGAEIYQKLDYLRGNSSFLDEFLYTIAEEPLTKNQIQKMSGLTPDQIEHFITNLESCNFLRKYGQDRWATTLPIVTNNQMMIIREDLAPMANDVAKFLAKETSRIKALYNEVKTPLDPSWEDVSHLIVDKLIIDASFHVNLNKLKREAGLSEGEDQKTSVMPAFLLQKSESSSNFGCNWYKFNEGDDQREVYFLHGAVLDRFDFPMEDYRGDKVFSAGLFKISPEGGIDALSKQEKKILSGLNWISGDRLLVPIVNAETIKSLLPSMKKIGLDSAEVAFSRFVDMTNSYNRSTYSEFLENEEDYVQVLIHSLFGLIIEELVESKTVQQVPENVPDHFGVFFVFGELF